MFCWGKVPGFAMLLRRLPLKLKTQHKGEIGIFWDYENTQVPDWCSAAKASECIRKHVEPRGRIIERKLYFDSSKTSQQPLEKSALDLSGFSLIDCPSRNRKETTDKKVIVDMLCFSYERALKGSNVQVVLISSDGDYSYALAKLRDIGVSTFVIYKPDSVASILTSTANEAVTWEDDILGGNPVLQPSRLTKSNRKKSTGTSKAPADNKTTLLFLRSVFDEQEPRDPWWVDGYTIAKAFYSRNEAEVANNAAYRSAKMDAIRQCYVEIGRQDLTQPERTIVISPKLQAGRSTRLYMRLTALGRLKVAGK
jgi:uncharacterized LabA/DUF88 family protein